MLQQRRRRRWVSVLVFSRCKVQMSSSVGEKEVVLSTSKGKNKGTAVGPEGTGYAFGGREESVSILRKDRHGL
ncbi:hypothetical protein C2845_PM05G00830 [Panicum miliaceum]|uniref:Uncharacterized protein n=1 Tax=Panicum miliaceum TaxID=4540 RepID=A0A3L6T036_PANMI|nr:hypothetical protein C2845_PM05G00830 [Panicum miliaceum]